jgi:hypothetical protein
MTNGFTLYTDPLRVIVATGFQHRSNNRKTGDMIQTWILPRRMDPVQAVSTGHDSTVCGDCPLRGVNGQERACYVNIGQAPLAIWRAWQRGSYPELAEAQVFQGRKVRFGAYGDPVHFPFPLLATIASFSNGWTGYTHQWRKPHLQAFRQYIMASVETYDQAWQAWGQGWRTFRVRANGEPVGQGEIECLSESRGISCADCRLCAGTSKPAKSISIEAHGSGKKFVQA